MSVYNDMIWPKSTTNLGLVIISMKCSMSLTNGVGKSFSHDTLI